MVTVKEFNQWSGRVAHFSGEYTLSREPLAAKMKGCRTSRGFREVRSKLT